MGSANHPGGVGKRSRHRLLNMNVFSSFGARLDRGQAKIRIRTNIHVIDVRMITNLLVVGEVFAAIAGGKGAPFVCIAIAARD